MSAQHELNKRLRDAGWNPVVALPPHDLPPSADVGAVGFARPYSIDVDGGPDGYPQGYRVSRDGEPAPHRTTERIRSPRVPTPEQAAGVWEDWRARQGPAPASTLTGHTGDGVQVTLRFRRLPGGTILTERRRGDGWEPVATTRLRALIEGREP